jgi:hypothetical protein
MATSKVEICRNGLLLLGDAVINSFDDDNDRTTLVANLWPNALNAVLRAHPWNCATAMQILGPEQNTYGFDYAYSFLLPGECLRVLSIGRQGESPEYELANGRVMMDENACYLRYIFKNENVSTFDAGLVASLEAYMAMLAAYPITKSASVQQAMQTLYLAQLKQAKNIDGQEQPMPEWNDSPLLAARRGG